MSWLDDIVDFGSTALNWFGNNGVGASLAKSALLGYGLQQVTKSINRDNQKTDTTTPDKGVRLTVDPSTDNKIPVVYGSAFVGGLVTDAELSDDNTKMYYVLTLCEVTGIKLSDSQASQISFSEIYYNDGLVTFQSDGITVASITDRAGTVNTDYAGLIKIKCYSGSTTAVAPSGYVLSAANYAYDAMPSWIAGQQTMSDLVYVIVELTYSKEKNVTSLGQMQFKLQNSMTMPGDCLYDMLTNTRYGAGIDPSQVFQS